MKSHRYNTSCEPCRKSRIGCDSVLRNPNPCTNCVRRDKACRRAGRRVSLPAARRDVLSNVVSRYSDRSEDLTVGLSELQTTGRTPTDSLSNVDFEDIANRHEQMFNLHYLLWDIFVSIWDSRALLWLSSSCNPFLEASAGDDSLMSRLVLSADHSLHELAADGTRRHSNFSTSAGSTRPRDHRGRPLNDAVRHAVYAYACRWLPFRLAFLQRLGVSEDRARTMEQEVHSQLWRCARVSMYAALEQPSYRSLLALSVFTFTEMPADENDFGFVHLCSEVLFSHVNYLSQPIRPRPGESLSEYTTVLPPDSEDREHNNPSHQNAVHLGEKLEHLRDSMFWMCVITDSSRSLIQQRPSVVLPCRSGEYKVWRLIRQRNEIFDLSFRNLHGSPLPLGQDVVNIILEHSLACKTMYYGILNQFCDAVVHSKTEPIEHAAQSVLDESRRFHETLDQLLGLCARDYLTLNAASRLNYTLIMAHYHLGTLVLADVVDTLDTSTELLKDPKLSRSFACTAIVNAVSLALNSDRYSDETSPYGSILLQDPTPITMVEVLSRTTRAIMSLHESGVIDSSTAQMMTSVVGAALTVLSQISTTATYALNSLRQQCAQARIKYKPSEPSSTNRDDASLLGVLGLCDRDFVEDFLKEMKLAEANSSDPLLDRTIAKYETSRAKEPVTATGYFADGNLADNERATLV